MASLQDQIDDLRRQLTALQSSIAIRALKSEVNTMNTVQGTKMDQIILKLNDLEQCVRELQKGLIDARTLLITHTH